MAEDIARARDAAHAALVRASPPEQVAEVRLADTALAGYLSAKEVRAEAALAAEVGRLKAEVAALKAERDDAGDWRAD